MSGPIAQAVIRTPQLSGVDAGCAPQCADSGAPFVYELEFDFQGSPATPYNISVAPPWEIIPFPEFVAPPICSGSPKSCWHFAGDSNLNLYIATTDPNAPARNVYIEPASACF